MKKELIVILWMAIGNCTTTKNSYNLSFGAGFKENENEKYIVGYFPVKEDFNPIEYFDINEACTAFIKREIEEIRTS